MSSSAFWKQTAVALTLPGLAVPALADQPPRQEVQGDDPEVRAPVVEGQQIGYTMDDILSAQAARARFGFDGDAAYVESLLKDLEQGDAVFGVGGVFTRDEIVIVQRQLRYEDAANALHEHLSSAEREEFGGLWIDHRNGGHITVAHVSPGERLKQEVRRRLGDAPFSITKVVSSEEILRGYLGAFAGIARAKGVRVDLEVLFKTNSIVVTGDAGELERFDEEVLSHPDAQVPLNGPIRLDVQVGEISVKEAFLHGGQLIDTKPGSVCTLGPTVYDELDGARERYVVTAGHCDKIGNGTHYIGNTKVGKTERSSERGEVDAALIAVAPGSYATDDILWFGNDGSVGRSRDVVGSYTQYVDGGTLCQSQGMSRRIRCGEVVTTSAINYDTNEFNYDKYGHAEVYKVNMCSRPGDSGSPAFYHQPGQDYVSIAGIHVAGTNNQDECTSSDHAWILKLDKIKSEFKVDLLTDD